MTTELTKAAQQAHTPEHIAGVDHAHELLRWQGYHRDGDYFINVNRRGAEAIHVLTISLIVHAGQLCALTQRPAAQTLSHDETHDWGDRIAKLQRPASLPAPQQATPEPVGEPVALWIDLKDGDTVQLGDRLLSGGKNWRTVDQESQLVGREYDAKHWWPMQRLATRPAPVEAEPVAKVADLFHAVRDRLVAQGADLYDPLFIRPAPGVPEGFTIDQIADACVQAEISDSKFESLSIALAAAQAKGGE